MNVSTRTGTFETSAGTTGSAARRLFVVVGYDGTAPASRALDQAAELLKNRDGELEVVYVAHLPASATLPSEPLSAQAAEEVERGFDEEATALAGEVRRRLSREDHPWHFQRRDGGVSVELMKVADDLHRRYGDEADIVIVVGGSAQWYHHLAGAVGSSVARSDRFRVMVVP